MISWSWLKACWHESSNLLVFSVGLSDYILFFSSLNCVSHSNFLFKDCVGIQWKFLSLYHLTNLSNSLLMLCYKCNLLHSIRLCPFWERPPFMPMDMHSFAGCVLSFRVTCWLFTILQLIYFFLFTFPFQHSIRLRCWLSNSRVQSLCNFFFLI